MALKDNINTVVIMRRYNLDDRTWYPQIIVEILLYYTCCCLPGSLIRALLLFWCWQQQHHVPQGEQGGQETHLCVQSVYIQGGRAVGIVRLQE